MFLKKTHSRVIKVYIKENYQNNKTNSYRVDSLKTYL